MLKNLNKRKKKKGFTLIELVIVLAVLAIIALIAIPNFTKVRNDSLAKADIQTAEQIKKITLMAIANDNVKISTNSAGSTFSVGDKGAVTNGANMDYVNGTTKADFELMLKEVSKPQKNGKSLFTVKIDTKGNVSVFYDSDADTLTK